MLWLPPARAWKPADTPPSKREEIRATATPHPPPEEISEDKSSAQYALKKQCDPSDTDQNDHCKKDYNDKEEFAMGAREQSRGE